MDRLLEESFVRPFRGWSERAESELAVSVDMYETDDDLVISAELPGLKPKDVDISLTDSRLTIADRDQGQVVEFGSPHLGGRDPFPSSRTVRGSSEGTATYPGQSPKQS
jgi:HSP20 family molecular chaperone IbpA